MPASPADGWFSLFLIDAVFAGVEFDDLAYGIVLDVDSLRRATLGTVIGTRTALMGIVLALAALIAPCPVDVPEDYLVLFVRGRPCCCLDRWVDAGHGHRAGGPVRGLRRSERLSRYASRRPVFRNAELHERIENVSACGGATMPASGDLGEDTSASSPAGESSGARIFELPQRPAHRPGPLGSPTALPARRLRPRVAGAGRLRRRRYGCRARHDGILDTFDVDGIVFGVTIATLALSPEDIFLTVEPARRERRRSVPPTSWAASCSPWPASSAIVPLMGGTITVNDNVLSWYLPVRLGNDGPVGDLSGGRAAAPLARGVLLVLRAVRLVIGMMAFGGMPLDGDQCRESLIV